MRLFTERKWRKRIEFEESVRHNARGVATQDCVGAVYDVLYGFHTIEEAMTKYFDPVWPDDVPQWAQDMVRRLLIEVEVTRDRAAANR